MGVSEVTIPNPGSVNVHLHFVCENQTITSQYNRVWVCPRAWQAVDLDIWYELRYEIVGGNSEACRQWPALLFPAPRAARSKARAAARTRTCSESNTFRIRRRSGCRRSIGGDWRSARTGIGR